MVRFLDPDGAAKRYGPRVICGIIPQNA